MPLGEILGGVQPFPAVVVELLRGLRAGDTFTAYESANGSTWTLVGSETMAMGASVYVGLAVTSHADGAICEARFDGVTIVP